MDMHPYAGSFAESLAFGDEQTHTPTPSYQVNILAFKHIPRCMSKQFSDFGDLSFDQSLHNDHHKLTHQTYKCFKCSGLKNTPNIKRQSKCRECQGTGYVSQNHPLVSVMQSIIKKKMPHMPLKTFNDTKIEDKQQFLKLQYGCRDEIKEQSFSYQEQPAIICMKCHKECDLNFYAYCEKCPEFNICENCYQKKRYQHVHKLVIKDMSRLPSRISAAASNKKKAQTPSETENYLDQLDMKCNNCKDLIDVCYQICLNCLQKGVKYIVCDKCSQRRQFPHQKSHIFDMRTLSHLSELTNMVSRKSQDDLQLNSMNHQSFEINISNSMISQAKNKSIQYIKRQSSNFNSLSDDLLEDEPILKNKLSNSYHNIGDFQKMERMYTFNISNYLDADLSSSMEIMKVIDEEPCTPFSPFFNSRVDRQKVTKNPEDQYVFNDYQCDICNTHPIKNKRYHCKLCENFDLCEVCYIVRSKQHEHTDFQEINKQQTIQNQKNSIIQLTKSRNIAIKIKKQTNNTVLK